jgi:hypothetical protein
VGLGAFQHLEDGNFADNRLPWNNVCRDGICALPLGEEGDLVKKKMVMLAGYKYGYNAELVEERKR